MFSFSWSEHNKLMLKFIIIFYISFLAVVSLFIVLGGWSKLSQYALEILLFLLVSFAAFSLGHWIGQKFLPKPFFSGWQGLLLSLALGFEGLSLISLLLGSLKILYEQALLGILAAFALFGAIRMKKPERRISLNNINLSFDEGLMLILVWAIVLINMLSALSPVVFYDAMVYHLNIPMEYLKSHRIFHVPYNMHSNLPQGMGMIYIYTLLMKSGVAAKLLNSFFGLLTAITLYLIARQWLSRRAAFITMLLFYSMPQIFLLSTLVNVDLPAAFYVLLALYCLLRSAKQSDKKWLLLAGIFCGVSMSFRYQNAIIAGMLLSSFIFLKKRSLPSSETARQSFFSRRNIIEFLKMGAIFCLAFLIIFSPWMIKNILYTGNPLFPLFYSIFGGRGWSLEQTRYFYNNISGRIGAGITLRSWLSILWQVLTREGELGWHRFIFLAALALIPLAIKRRHPATIAGLLGLFYLALWPLLSRNVANILRYNIFSFALLSLFFISMIWQWISRKEKLTALAFMLFIGIETFFGIFFCQQLTQSFMPVFTKVSRQQYLKSFLPYYPLVDEMNRRLSTEDRVLFIGETRGFYLKKKCIVPSANDGQWTSQIFEGAKNVEEVSQRMKDLGITHLLVNQQELERLKPLFGYLDWKREEERDLFYKYIKSRRLIGRYRYIYLLSS